MKTGTGNTPDVVNLPLSEAISAINKRMLQVKAEGDGDCSSRLLGWDQDQQGSPGYYSYVSLR